HDLSSDRWSRTHDPIRSGECSANIDSESATGGSSATPFVPDSLDVRRKYAPEVFGDISQLRSQRHVRGCRSGQVEFVVWLAQMVAVMPSIVGDQSRIRTGRMWRGARWSHPRDVCGQTTARCGRVDLGCYH